MLINIICSEGYASGREVDTLYGDDIDCIERAYRIYLRLFSQAYDDGMLDDGAIFATRESFKEAMLKGKTCEDHYIVLQLKDCHYQFEPIALQCKQA